MQIHRKVMTQAGPSVLRRATGTPSLEKTLIAKDRICAPSSMCHQEQEIIEVMSEMLNTCIMKCPYHHIGYCKKYSWGRAQTKGKSSIHVSSPFPGNTQQMVVDVHRLGYNWRNLKACPHYTVKPVPPDSGVGSARPH